MVITFSGVLTGIFLTPVIGAVVILLLKKEAKEQARIIAATCTGIALLLALFVFFGYSVDDANAINGDGGTYFALRITSSGSSRWASRGTWGWTGSARRWCC